MLGPNKSKILAEGKVSCPFENILKTFGLRWEKLDLNEKRVISNFVVETYKLEYYEKGEYI